MSRAEIETSSRASWRLDKFLWFRPAASTRAFRIVLDGELLQCLGAQKLAPSGKFILVQPRSHTVVTTMKSICRMKGARWHLTLGEHSEKEVERGKLKRSPLRRLRSFKELHAFAKQVRTLRRSRGVHGEFVRKDWPSAAKVPSCPSCKKEFPLLGVCAGKLAFQPLRIRFRFLKTIAVCTRDFPNSIRIALSWRSAWIFLL